MSPVFLGKEPRPKGREAIPERLLVGSGRATPWGMRERRSRRASGGALVWSGDNAGPVLLPFVTKSVCSGRTLAPQHVGLGGVTLVWGGAAERSVDSLSLHCPGPSCGQKRSGSTLVTGRLQPPACA